MKSPLKVLVVTNLFPNNKEPNRGMFMKQQIGRLAELCEVQVLAPVTWFPFKHKIFAKWAINAQVVKQEEIEGIKTFHSRWFITPKILRSFYGFFYFLSLLPSVFRIRKSFSFDIIDGQWIYPDGFAVVLFGKIFKKPVILHALGCDINEYKKYFLLRRLIIWALRNATKIITVSDNLKKEIVALGISSAKVHCIPNGVDVNLFKQMPQLECRKILKLAEVGKIILFIGRLEYEKGLSYLIEAISHILTSSEKKQLQLIIIGEGNLKNEIKNQIESLYLTPSVTFAGNLLHQELPVWINACDLLCLPSIREGMPNVVLEALACKKSIVATNVGGLPEMVRTEEDGLLVPPQNSQALAEAIIKVLEKPEIPEKKYRGLTWAENAQKVFDELNIIAGAV